MSDSRIKSLSTIVDERLTDQALSELEKPLKTGFDVLDQCLEGGITPGLIVLGAGPGQGKSTFCEQLAEYVSGKENVPVLYFSLEMTQERIAAKLLTMESFRSAKKEGFPVDDFPDGKSAKQKFFTAADLFNFYALESMPDEKRRQLKEARERVRENKNLYVIDKPYCAREIVEAVNRFVRDHEAAENSQETQKRKMPLVIVDYLQILPPDPQVRAPATDKQQMDQNLKVLRGLIQKQIPVILISSLSRGNYSANAEPMKSDSFKETGNIEYSADVLMGIQFSACHQKGGCNTDTEKGKYPREIEITILKQRYGAADIAVPLRYYAEFDYMEEKDPWEANGNKAEKQSASKSKPKSRKPGSEDSGEKGKSAEPDSDENPETVDSQETPEPTGENQAQAASAETSKKTARDELRKKAEIQYMNNTKIANEIRNGRWKNGQTARCNVASRTKEPVITEFQIDGELSCFDCDVADAVYSVYRSEHKEFTIRQVMQTLSGDVKQTLTVQRRTEIKESLARLMKAEITITCTQEMSKMRKKPEMLAGDKIIIKGQFLAAKELEDDKYTFEEPVNAGSADGAKSTETQETKETVYSSTMPLYYYGELTQQMIAFPKHLLAIRLKDGKKLSDTAENIMIKRYLIRRLEVIRKGKNSDIYLQKVNYYSKNMKSDSGMLATIGVRREDYEPAAWQNKLRKTHKTVTGILDCYAERKYIDTYRQEKPFGVALSGKVNNPYELKAE